MTKVAGFRELRVWQKAIDLTEQVYRVTQALPSDERYGLTSQMRRAAVSIGANIAEGYASRGARNRARYFAMSKTSAEELRHYIILTHRLGYLSSQIIDEAPVDEVCAMLYRLWEANCPADER
jgi:four helix bundle protein